VQIKCVATSLTADTVAGRRGSFKDVFSETVQAGRGAVGTLEATLVNASETVQAPEIYLNDTTLTATGGNLYADGVLIGGIGSNSNVSQSALLCCPQQCESHETPVCHNVAIDDLPPTFSPDNRLLLQRLFSFGLCSPASTALP
jgi:hypothetical protein